MSSSHPNQETKELSKEKQDDSIEARKKRLSLRAEEELLLKTSDHDKSQRSRSSRIPDSSKSGQAITEGVPSDAELFERRARRKNERERNERNISEKEESERSSVSFAIDHSGAINVREIKPIDAKVTIATPTTIIAEPVTGDDYTEELEQQVIEHKQKIKLQQEEMTNMEIRRQSERRLRRTHELRLEQLEIEHDEERNQRKRRQLMLGTAAIVVVIILILVIAIPGGR